MAASSYRSHASASRAACADWRGHPKLKFAILACCTLLIAHTAWSPLGRADATSDAVAAVTTDLRQSKHHRESMDDRRSAHDEERRESRTSRSHSRRDSRDSSSSYPPVVERSDDTYPPHDPSQFPGGKKKDHSGVSDENILDESHQQRIVAMYGGEPIHPDPENPYSFPGMTPNEGPHDWDYAITIDCGSKGSRVHIYKWFQHATVAGRLSTPFGHRRIFLPIAIVLLFSLLSSPLQATSSFSEQYPAFLASVHEARVVAARVTGYQFVRR
jgi:hypothetical protein